MLRKYSTPKKATLFPLIEELNSIEEK